MSDNLNYVEPSAKMYNTTVNNTPTNTPEYAHFGYRLAAYLVDYVILSAIALVLMLILAIPFWPSVSGSFNELISFDVKINDRTNSRLSHDQESISRDLLTQDENDQVNKTIFNLMASSTGWIFLSAGTMMIVYGFYYSWFDSSKYQGTPGKILLKIKITDLNGNRISFLRGLGRFFAMYVTSFTFGIGYLMPLFTEKKQTLHDLIASCVVVRRNPNE